MPNDFSELLFFVFPEKWQQSGVQKESWLKFFNDGVAPRSLVPFEFLIGKELKIFDGEFAGYFEANVIFERVVE